MKDKRGKITLEFFCDEGGEDIFSFQIVTGLTDKDIERLKEKGKAIPKEMAVRLIDRKSEEQAIKDYDNRPANQQQVEKIRKTKVKGQFLQRKH